jgi:hypothetical protein
MSPVRLQRIDSETVQVAYTQGARIIAASRRQVIEHGTVMAITTISNAADGHSSTNYGVFKRVDENPPRSPLEKSQ